MTRVKKEALQIELLRKSQDLPKDSGCYLMKNIKGEVIYIGKAKSLKNRVASYFNSSVKNAKTQILVSHIKTFDFILTQSEAESLVLENNLIKKYKPKYNIRLKDDKTYPYLLVNYNEDFPRLEYVRRPKKRKNIELFGPFPFGYPVKQLIQILNKTFQLRDCTLREFNSRQTPCILHQMEHCSAPCVNYISKEEYGRTLNLALNLFKNKSRAKETINYLESKMTKFAEQEEFEKAALYRDYLVNLNEFMEKNNDQSVEFMDDRNVDIISYYKGEEYVDISIYLVRSGNLLGHKNFNFLLSEFMDDIEDEVIGLLLQYYSSVDQAFAQQIIIDIDPSRIKPLKVAIQDTLGEGINFSISSGSQKYKSILDSTREHAKQKQLWRLKNQDSVYVGLNRLKELLKMKQRPRVLECYDIAIWSGKSPTASQIVFHEGKSEKSEYRYYNLKELPEGNNDFAMMKEVFTRRLDNGNLPDVFVVDGGKGQVNTVLKVLEEFEINIPVVGIAKQRTLKGDFRSSQINQSQERLMIPNRINPYPLHKCPPLMKIIVAMRDEAHRFSRKLHHKKEKKRIITSWVDDIKGINKEVRSKILTNNTLEKDELKKLNISELSRFLGINEKHAKKVYDFLHA